MTLEERIKALPDTLQAHMRRLMLRQELEDGTVLADLIICESIADVRCPDCGKQLVRTVNGSNCSECKYQTSLYI